MSDDTGEICAACGAIVVMGKWICRCGHILRLDFLRHEKPSDPVPLGDGVVNDEPTPLVGAHAQPTTRFDPVTALSEMFQGRVAPAPAPGSDIFKIDLSPIEMFVLSKIDGQRASKELMRLTGLKQVELSVVLLNLLRAGAITGNAQVSFDTQAGSGEWQTLTPVEQMSARADEEFALYKEHRGRGDVTNASLHLKRSVVYNATPAVVDEIEKHFQGVIERCARFYREVRQMLTQGRAKEARQRLAKGLVEFPGEAGFYNLMAVCVTADGRDYTAARDYLERAVQLDPENEAYRANLAKIEDRLLRT